MSRTDPIVKIKQSISTLLIFGSIPLLLLVLDLLVWLKRGTIDQDLLLISISIFLVLFMWSRGETIILTKDRLVHRKFFVPHWEIGLADIAKCTAISKFEIGARPPFRLEIYSAQKEKPDHVINLKPFRRKDINLLFTRLPNLKTDGFTFTLMSKD
ncbi:MULTISPECIES: hypothetical protein [Kordiimonas]|jgi:hypothetical protein|uniref:hypothetical protein n=1 Tax=Kordiimonas TaxID=288021 RepID=UPI00257C11F4|nr:hypothetical protein [Kordiimonas sp. UBA4487]